jgi:hypothetical protein
MEYWLKRGFELKGTGPQSPDMFIACKPGQYAVVRRDFWDQYQKETEWFRTEQQAREVARELQTA